ncbi:MAG: polysaccharide lyase family 7 protein [Reichenbachiella sp.]
MKDLNKIISVLILLITLVACGSEDKVLEEIEQPLEDEEEVAEIGKDSVVDTASNIVWKNWYLSVPLDKGEGKATSIFYEDIVANNFTKEASEYFHLNEDSSYTMYTKFTGFTTSGLSALNGKYCRTELREFWKGNQDTNDNWPMSTGTHALESTLKVVYCEGNGRTYVAQIHGKESAGISGNPATVKVQWDNDDLIIEYYVKPDEGEPWTSDFDKKINIGTVKNDKFIIKIKIEGGKLYYALICEVQSIDIDYTLVYDYVGNGYQNENYFKTGNYFKHNADYTQSSQVTLYEVKTIHE